MRLLLTVGCLCLTTLLAAADNHESAQAPRTGTVRLAGHSLVDDTGPFLGLGVSYLNALWRCKHDRARLEPDLAFLSRCGFNYYRMVSIVGYYPAWNGLEIAPVSFKNREGKYVEARHPLAITAHHPLTGDPAFGRAWVWKAFCRGHQPI